MTDRELAAHSSLDMVIPDVPRIIAAERLNAGLVIKFENGRCAFYSCAFLFSKLSECKELSEADIEW